MRKLIVGDIHGCFEELMELIQQSGITEEDLLISVGDIVDRGNQSKEVWQYLKKRPNTVVLMGNHERKHQNQVLSYAQEIVKLQFENEYPAFLSWLESLPYYFETEEAIIIHAFLEHDLELSAQKPEVLAGSTAGERFLQKKYPEGSFWSDYYEGNKPVIYGHHVVGDAPKIEQHTIGIDTGACHGGLLTAIELPGFLIHQVKAKKDYWKEQQTLWQVPVLKAKPWQDMTFEEIQKQIQKLAYIQDPETVTVLAEIQIWSETLQVSLSVILQQIELLTAQLLQDSPETFVANANQFSFKNLLFKCKSQQLTIKDLQKSLNTPSKILHLQQELKPLVKL